MSPIPTRQSDLQGSAGRSLVRTSTPVAQECATKGIHPKRLRWIAGLLILVAASAMVDTATMPLVPGVRQAAVPAGFTSLFDGRTLDGWRGRPGGGGVFSPYVEAAFTDEERRQKQAEWNADRDQHWRVDVERREIVSDGHGVHLATTRDYGDFEFLVDWKLTQPGGDSGIYLRNYPQVQIWDPDHLPSHKNGSDKGSGALWNNNADNPGKFPLVRADRPIGEWNTLRIRMVDRYVWVWLNDRQTVNGQVLDNYFDRARPVRPRGSIELQTHGSEVRFRNVFIREIPADEAQSLLASRR